MTFIHQIDVEPATIGRAAMALKANARQSSAKCLPLRRFGGVPDRQRFVIHQGRHFPMLYGQHRGRSRQRARLRPPKTKTRGGHMSVVTTQPEMLAATMRAPRPLTRSRTAKGQ